MIVLKGFQEIKKSFPHVFLTIGNYDGIHLGHQEILKKIVSAAKRENGTSVVYTFRPHPHFVVKPQTEIKLLNSYDEKIELIEKLGIDVCIEEPFTREFSNITAEKFFSEVILKSLGTRSITVGYDFGFGKNRAGSLESLQKICKQHSIELRVQEPFRIKDEVCSSSKIRAYLKDGQVKQAANLLGRSFFYRGVVVKGNRRGHQLGFATANFGIEEKVQLKPGVYASFARRLKDGKLLKSITNIGFQPTFNSNEKNVPVTVETHILDFDEDIYGEQLEVQFIGRIRDEQRFSGKEELIRQIILDISTAREVLADCLR